MPRGWGAQGTAELIRAYLIVKGRGNPYSVWKFITEWLGSRRKRYKPPTYDSIRKFFYMLHTMGIIVPTFISVEESIPQTTFAQRKRFYRIADGQVDNPAWRDPTIAKYYPGRFISIQRLERVTLEQETFNEIRNFITQRGL
jgi:hypothetical protein